MKDVYEEEYEILKNVNLTAKPPKNFKRNRKIVIDNNENTKFPIHSKPYGGKGLWLLQCNDDFRYNTTTKRWVYKYSYYPYNTNIAGITSIKALVKHLKKQYLPKNIKFTINGRYVGEEYLVKIL
jgi:hypothetical protein